MKGISRIVNTAFWNDTKVGYFTPEDKYFFLYLLTNPHTTQLGIYEFPLPQVAFEMGYSQESVKNLLRKFENKYDILLFSEETGEIAIKNYLRYSVIKGGTPVLDCLIKEAKSVKDKRLLDYVVNHIDEISDVVVPTVLTFRDYINENDIEEEKDNDNERNVPTKRKKASTEPKKAFGENGNVKLTDAEYDRLINKYGKEVADESIEYLDLYIGEKNYKSVSHVLAIQRWVVDAVTKKKGKQTRSIYEELENCI